jgi:hypothetical protein
MIEVLKQALEALNNFADGVHYDGEYDEIGSHDCCGALSYNPHSESCKATKAIASINQAIAELKSQEPVIDKSAAKRIATALGWSPQREWVGLTDEERIDILVDAVHTKWDDQEIIKAIEAKFKEKNGFAEYSSVTEQNICSKCRSFFCDHTCKTNPEEKNNA